MSKSISVSDKMYNVISAYAENRHTTKKDAAEIIMEIALGRKNIVFDWYCNEYLSGGKEGKNVEINA